MLSISSVLQNFISTESVFCHQTVINTSNILSPFLKKIRWFYNSYANMQSPLLIPLPSQDLSTFSLGLWSSPSQQVNSFLTYTSWTSNTMYMLMTLRFMLLFQTSPPRNYRLCTPQFDIWTCRSTRYLKLHLAGIELSIPTPPLGKGGSSIFTSTTVNGSAPSPNCSDLTPGCHLPFLIAHTLTLSNPSELLHRDFSQWLIHLFLKFFLLLHCFSLKSQSQKSYSRELWE